MLKIWEGMGSNVSWGIALADKKSTTNWKKYSAWYINNFSLWSSSCRICWSATSVWISISISPLASQAESSPRSPKRASSKSTAKWSPTACSTASSSPLTVSYAACTSARISRDVFWIFSAFYFNLSVNLLFVSLVVRYRRRGSSGSQPWIRWWWWTDRTKI